MGVAKGGQQPHRLGSQSQVNPAAVALGLHPFDQAVRRQPVGHAGEAVRLQQHRRGELTDGHGPPVGRAQGEQDLVLLGSQTGGAGNLLREMGEGAQLGADQRQGAIVAVADQWTWPSCLARRWRNAAANMKPKRISSTPPPNR